jgi:hypothetical protein
MEDQIVSLLGCELDVHPHFVNHPVFHNLYFDALHVAGVGIVQ